LKNKSCIKILGHHRYKGSDVTLIELGDCSLDELMAEVEPLPFNYTSGYCILLSSNNIIGLAYLVHELHPSRFISIYDKSVNACIVVSSHYPGVNVGEKINI